MNLRETDRKLKSSSQSGPLVGSGSAITQADSYCTAKWLPQKHFFMKLCFVYLSHTPTFLIQLINQPLVCTAPVQKLLIFYKSILILSNHFTVSSGHSCFAFNILPVQVTPCSLPDITTTTNFLYWTTLVELQHYTHNFRLLVLHQQFQFTTPVLLSGWPARDYSGRGT
jgi:hypothetical protein